jgi:hypothetical protein
LIRQRLLARQASFHGRDRWDRYDLPATVPADSRPQGGMIWVIKLSCLKR